MPEFDLKKALQDNRQDLTRKVTFFPGGSDEGFELEIKYVNTKAWRKARNALMNKSMTEVAQELAANKKFRATIAGAIRGWKGLTPDRLLEMVDLDPAAVPEGLEEVPYTPETALVLVEEHGPLSSFLYDELTKLAAFRAAAAEAGQKN